MLLALQSTPGLMPAEGRVAFLHARPEEQLKYFGERLLCEQNSRATVDALTAAGFTNTELLDGKFTQVLLLQIIGSH